MKARESVAQHLRAVEDGDWDKAMSFIDAEYSMTGTFPSR